jgi:phosphohistidine phosphatase SixA
LLGQRFADDGIHPDAVLSSPLLRARETAAEIAKAVGVAAEADERLAPGADPDDVRAATSGRGETVVVVGHQPDCGRTVAAFSGGPEPAFPPGAVVAVEV